MTARVLAFILAGEGRPLQPLTRNLPLPALPFGPRHRLIDFTLSNLLNSDIRSSYLLSRHMPDPLLRHVRRHWTGIGGRKGFHVVPPPGADQPAHGMRGGAAEALRRHRHLIRHHRPDVVAVLSADQVCRMDLRQMVGEHLAQDADVTVATAPARAAGVPARWGALCDGAGRVVRLAARQGAPESGRRLEPRMLMGVHLFHPDTLMWQLSHPDPGSALHRDVLARLVSAGRVRAYDATTNRVIGARPHEECAYWRRIDSLQAYYEAHMDMLGARPRFEPSNPFWPLGQDTLVGGNLDLQGEVSDCLIGEAGAIGRARVARSVVRDRVHIGDGAELDRCVVLDGAVIGRGARLRGVIVGPEQVVQPGTVIDAWQGRSGAPVLVMPEADAPAPRVARPPVRRQGQPAPALASG